MIWLPKIDFVNLKSIEKPIGFGYHKTQEYYANNKNLFAMAENFKIKISCHFEFQNFPFDQHDCDLLFYTKQYPPEYVILNPVFLIGMQ